MQPAIKWSGRGIIYLALIVDLIGCAHTPTTPGGGITDSGSPVYYYHDDVHHVSCWLYGTGGSYGKGISCLPDAQVVQ